MRGGNLAQRLCCPPVKIAGEDKKLALVDLALDHQQYILERHNVSRDKLLTIFIHLLHGRSEGVAIFLLTG